MKAGDEMKARGLAGAVRPDQRHGFVFLHGEADVLNGAQTAEPFAEAADHERICHDLAPHACAGLRAAKRCRASVDHAHQPRRTPKDHGHQDQAVDGQLDSADRTAEPALQKRRGGFQQDGADQRSPKRSDAADDRDQRGFDRDVEGEGGRGIDEVDVLGVERAGERGQECADHIDVALHLRCVDADRFGRIFVLADRHQVVSDPGSLDQPGDEKAQQEKSERDIVVRALVLELHHQRRGAEIRNGRAFGAPGEIAELQEDQHQRLRGRDGRDREVGATQAEAQPADRQARDRSHDTAGDHADPRRDVVVDLEDGRGIGAEAEIGGVPERKLLGVTAHQIPGGADKGEQQDPHENIDRKRALHHHRQTDEDGYPDCDEDGVAWIDISHHRARPPPRPVGLKASVSNSIANTTINPESAPTY